MDKVAVSRVPAEGRHVAEVLRAQVQPANRQGAARVAVLHRYCIVPAVAVVK